MRRPESNKCHDAAAGRVAAHNYVQRLSVQVPRKSAADAHHQHDPHEDVLRLVIHVEESSSQCNSREDVPSAASPWMRYPAQAGSAEDVCAYPPLGIRRKISWHSDFSCQRTRQLLKQIKRQRSTSLESLPFSRPIVSETTAPEETQGLHQPQRLIRSASWRNDSKRMRHRCGSQGASSSSKTSIAKEFRRSSELLRNILLSLSSRRSSESSVGHNKESESSSPYLCSLPIEAPDLQAALVTHSERQWPQSVAADSPASVWPLMDCRPSDLFEAVACGDLNRTRLLLSSGLDPNASNESGYTVLHWCTVQTPVPWLMILELLQSGSRVEQPDRDGTQPVFLVPNLPRIQHQLIKDAIDFLQRPALVDVHPDEGHHAQGSREAHRAAANLFRRFQQSTARKLPVTKNKPRDPDGASDMGNTSDTPLFKVCQSAFPIQLPFHGIYHLT